jgi:hypothetical protein
MSEMSRSSFLSILKWDAAQTSGLGHVNNFLLHHWNRNLHGLLNVLMVVALEA